jgi:hypothetical protein
LRTQRHWYEDPWKLGGAILAAVLAVVIVYTLWPKPPPPPPPPPTPQSLVHTQQVWESDNCLHIQVQLVQVVTSDTPTELCSDPVQQNGFTYFYLFSRGGSPDQWVEEISNDGSYRYFLYPNMPWLRQDPNGGAIQIKVQFDNRTVGFEDLTTYGPSTTFYIRLDSAEAAVNHLADEAYQVQLNTGRMNSDQAQQAQSTQSSQEQQINQLQTQLDQTKAQLQQAQGEQTVANEEQFLEQENAREWRITTAPPCYYSNNNGCGP